MRQLAFYGAVLIGTYLVVSYATGAGRVLTATGGGLVVPTVRAFQGR